MRTDRPASLSSAFLLLATLSLAGAPIPGRADAGAPTGAGDKGHGIAVGVYFNEGRHYCPDDKQSFEDLQRQTGRLAKVYMNFQNWSEQWRDFSTRLADNALAHGGVFMVVWMPAGANVEPADPEWTCRATASGKHDAYIRKYAGDVARWGAAAKKPVMIRFAHEMNGGWYPYGSAFKSPGRRCNGNTPADYVAMWRHVHQLFKEAGATNATWVWSPNLLFINANNPRAQAEADFAALYPGDDVVDWIGLDGYNDGIKSKWKSFSDLFGDSYKAITKLSAKPLMIAEFGCSEKGAPRGTSKADWIRDAYMNAIPGQFPRVLLVNWFDRDKTRQGEADWRFNSSPAALEAYRQAVNSPRYSSAELKLETQH